MLTIIDATRLVSLLPDRDIGRPPIDPTQIRFDRDCFEHVGSDILWGVMLPNGRLLAGWGLVPLRFTSRAEAEEKARVTKGRVVTSHRRMERRTRWF